MTTTDTTQRRYLSPTDYVFYAMQRFKITWNVTMLIWLEGDVEKETAIAILEKLCECEPKFRQRCVEGDFWHRPYWVDVDVPLSDEEVHDDRRCSVTFNGASERPWSCADNLDQVFISPEKPPAVDDGLTIEEREKRMLEALVAESNANVLDPHKPMWRATLIRGLTGNRTGLIMTAHHCMADGAGFALMLTSLMSPDDEGAMKKFAQEAKYAKMAAAYMPPKMQMPSFDANTTVAEAAVAILRTIGLALYVYAGYPLLTFLFHIYGVIMALILAARILTTQRSSLRYTRPHPQAKCATWTKAMSMSDIALIRKAHPGTTLNDIMVTCMERGFQAGLLAAKAEREEAKAAGRTPIYRDCEKEDPFVKMVIPKAMRMPGDVDFENKLSVDVLLLPTQPESYPIREAVRKASQAMTHVKRSMLALYLKFLMNLLYTNMPGLLSYWFLFLLCDITHGILTNVPGADYPLWLSADGKRHQMLGYIIYPPMMTQGSLAMGVCSYNGQVFFTAMADKTGDGPDRARLMIEHFEQTYQEILKDARQKFATTSS